MKTEISVKNKGEQILEFPEKGGPGLLQAELGFLIQFIKGLKPKSPIYEGDNRVNLGIIFPVSPQKHKL